MWPGNLKQEVRRQDLNFQSNFLDLTREQIDAAQNNHVIGAAYNAIHPTVTGPSSSGSQGSQVVGAEPNDGQGLSRESRDYQRAGLAIRQQVSGERIHDLR